MKTYQNPVMTILFAGAELCTDVISVSAPSGSASAREVGWLEFLGEGEDA